MNALYADSIGMPGARWSPGTRHDFLLDLADLPPSSAGVTNILGDLDDGNFDIFIQDDTGVDCATLTVEFEDDCDPGLTGVYHDGGNSYDSIDTMTGAATPILAGGSPVTANLQGVTALARDGDLAWIATGDSDDSLYVTNLATGTASFIGAFGGGATNIQAMDLATDASATHGFTPGKLYGVSIDGIGGCGTNCLLEIDPATGVASALAGLGLQQGRGASFDPVIGELWVLDTHPKRLYTVAPDGTLTFKAQLPEANQGEETGLSTAYTPWPTAATASSMP